VRIATAIFLTLLPAAALAAAGAAHRALVVGNSAYSDLPALKNGVNDARLMAETLKSIGFEVTALFDGSKGDFERTVLDFRRSITPESIVLVYYSGHGIQVGETNYLLPVDATVTSLADLSLVAVSVDSILHQIEQSKSKANLVILDACRDNPLREQFARTRSIGDPEVTRGLAAVRSASIGTFIAFATAPGETALDGSGENSPYSQALAETIKTPGLTVEEIFKQTRAVVLHETGGQQVPWENSSLIDSIVLVPSKAVEEKVVTSCDLLAEHPSDPERVVAGVMYENLDPQQAVPACMETIAEHPDEMRFKSLAARALEKAGRYDEAIELNKEAMAAGYLGAYHNMGNHYKKGAGVPLDLPKALELFTYAAERGHPEDQYNLGVLYMNGEGGVPQDYAKAEEWLTLASQQNWASAFDKLGLLYLKGMGRPADQAQAADFFRRGAALGDASAMVNYANVLKSEGDMVSAHDYYLRAARLGRTAAFANLGNIYLKGAGAEKNLVEAMFWFRLAARDGHEQAMQQVVELKKVMDEAALQAVEKMLEDWDSKRFG
jgi:TPR repeat protein